jgi:hypothetical protein
MARRKRYLRNDLSLWDVPTHWRTCLCAKHGPSAAFAVLLAMGHDPDTAESMVRLARPRARLRYLMDAIAAVA